MYSATQRVRSRNSGASAFNKTNYSESMTDWVVPEFRKKQNQGILLNHPMTTWRYETQTSLWSGRVEVFRKEKRVTSPYELFTRSYTTNGPPSFWVRAKPHPQWVTDARSLISSRMAAKGVGFVQQGDIDLAITDVSSRIGSGCAQIWVTYAESRKTIGMLCKALRLLRTPVRDALRALGLTVASLRHQRNREKVWMKACEIWLEARYGWRPFIFDAMALWDASVRAGDANNRLTKVKVVGNSEVVEPSTKWFDLVSIYPLAGHVAVDVRLQRYVKTGQTADFNAMITGPARVFGVYDIAGTVWELIPFSWVVDKFINLGNVCQALQAALICDERIGWVTKIELAGVTNPRTIMTAPGPVVWNGFNTWYDHDTLAGQLGGRDLDKCVSKERIVLSNFTPVMGIEGKLDFAEYLDLLALFRVLRKG